MEANARARSGGWALVVAGLVGAGAAGYFVVVPPAVPDDRFSFPLTASGFIVIQVAFFVHHIVVAWGLWAFWHAGLAGAGRLAKVGGISTVAAMAALAAQELAAISAADAAYPSAQTDAIEGIYGLLTMATGVALVLLGIAAIRARVLAGVGRYLALILGIFVFVPLTPAIFGGFVLGRVTIGVWLLLFAWLGLAMARWASTHHLTGGRSLR